MNFAAGDGYLTIQHTDDRGSATLSFTNLNSTDAVMRRIDADGDDWMIYFPQTTDQITLIDLSRATDTPAVEFADGVVWGFADMAERLIASQQTDRSDLIIGSAISDVIMGGKGNDTIDGGDGADTYIFTRGDGRDVISDSGLLDTLEICGYLPSEMTATPSFDGQPSVLLTFEGTDDEILLTYRNASCTNPFFPDVD